MPASPARNKFYFSSSFSLWIFWAGLVIFIVFQTSLVLQPLLQRVLPPECDDAYLYIYSAIQFGQGYNYDTPALRDFRTQSSPEIGDSVDRQNLKWELHHAFHFTHVILHSVLLFITSSLLGLSFETAYKIIYFLGSLLIAGAISFFLLTITDRTSAGLALASMALTTFPYQGIHFVVPNNICMAVALILVASVLRSGGRSRWLLFGLSIICLFLHRVGFIYVGLGIFLVNILRYKDENKRQLFFDLLPTLILVFFYVLITFIFPLHMFRLGPMAVPLDTNYYREVWFNGIELLKLGSLWFYNHGVGLWPNLLLRIIFNNWISFLGFLLLGLCLILLPWLSDETQDDKIKNYGWMACFIGIIIFLPIFSAIVLIIILRLAWLDQPQEKKTAFRLAFWGFFLILFPSLLHVMYISEPGHPIIHAALTNKLWVPFAVVLAATFGRGLSEFFRKINRDAINILPAKFQDYGPVKAFLRPRYLWLVLLSFLLFGYTPHLLQDYAERESIKFFLITRQNVTFDPDQVEWVYKHTSPQDIIVYDDDVIRNYFMCQGGLWRRAIYLPILPLPEGFNLTPEHLKYEIGWNPFLSVHFYENVRAFTHPLTIPAEAIYTLTFDSDFQPTELHLLPGSSKTVDGYFKLRIIRESATSVIKEDEIHLAGNTWQTYPLLPGKGGSLSLVNLDSSKPCFLAGLKFEGRQDSTLLWPWHGICEVKMDDKKRWIKRSVLIPRERKIKGLSYDLEVLQDHGSTVLWEIHPKKN